MTRLYTAKFDVVDNIIGVTLDDDGKVVKVNAVADGDVQSPFDGKEWELEDPDDVMAKNPVLDDDVLATLEAAFDDAPWGNPSMLEPTLTRDRLAKALLKAGTSISDKTAAQADAEARADRILAALKEIE